jgi:hypothetical protein
MIIKAFDEACASHGLFYVLTGMRKYFADRKEIGLFII